MFGLAMSAPSSSQITPMDDPDWYPDWRHEAFHMLQAKNAEDREEFKLGDWPRYDYDIPTRSLIFSEDGKAKVTADIQVVGTTSERAGNWLWAWANDHWPLEATEDAERACRFGEEHGIDELISGYVEDDDLNSLGWQLTAIAARICDGAGAYRPPSDDGSLFLLYHHMRWVS
jgi:hypothetical protein